VDFSFNSEIICDLILVADLNEKSAFLALGGAAGSLRFPEKAGWVYDLIENGLVYVLTEIDS
jgi:hypothetical protein